MAMKVIRPSPETRRPFALRLKMTVMFIQPALFIVGLMMAEILITSMKVQLVAYMTRILLTPSSILDHAMKTGEDPPVGTMIGKALQGLESGTGVILILVMLQ